MTTAVTLDNTVEAFEHWRATKKSTGASQIPSELWDMVFSLEAKGLSPSVLKGALSISFTQYQTQKQKRLAVRDSVSSLPASDNRASSSTADTLKFVEAKCSRASSSKPEAVATEAGRTVKAIKSNHNNSDWLSTDTVIVECIRQDGHQLKIHMTSKRINEILSAFFHNDYQAGQLC